ncbi:Ger(x)C family spore germination protein [Paenibacillus crassostreae]|uniref:Spore gernimation protein GerC n=1 Tax=Paenibacillus crassostreae TaxID=1763538 RepID=A0A167GJ51_9BACL|nr:Ger(x)C family spore germination protein [Paenibacillus crassostreae]AOZ92160.1 spore gernimation protein GerC [Paenibacillus crassostreae]OAB77621.1 spore gernimation protein GerC [Paenibacillus crassostreae]
MKRKGLLLCILLILTILISGCWSRRELNNLAIGVGLAIDKSGDKYKVSIQVVEPNAVSGKQGDGTAPVTMYQASGDSILQTLRRMTTVSPRRIYLAHLRMFVIGESLAREGISEVLDFLSREPEIRSDFFVVVSKKAQAEDTLKILTNLEKIPSVRLFSTLETSAKYWAPSTTVTLDKLISELVSEGKHPVLTGLKIIGNLEQGQTKKNVETVMSPADLLYSGLAVFKNDKLIGWLNDEEGKAYNYITNNISATVGVTPCPEGGTVSLSIINSDTKVTGIIHNERPQINIEVLIEGNVGEAQCQIDLSDPEVIKGLEKRTNQITEEFIEKTINQVQQEFKVDIFGFGEVIRRSHPQEWKELKENWDQKFVNIPVNVKVKTNIHHLGKLSNTFLEKMKK